MFLQDSSAHGRGLTIRGLRRYGGRSEVRLCEHAGQVVARVDKTSLPPGRRASAAGIISGWKYLSAIPVEKRTEALEDATPLVSGV